MSHIKLAKPTQGEHVVLDAYSGKVLELNFSAANAELARSGQDLLIAFPDESSITLPDFYTVYAATALPGIVVDGVLTRGEHFFESLSGDLLPHASVMDTGGRFALLPEAELMGGTDSLGLHDQPDHTGLNPNGLENPLDFLLPAPGDLTTLQGEPLLVALQTEAPAHPLPADPADTQQGNDSLLGFASDDALFGGNDNDILVPSPDSNLPGHDSGTDKVYGDTTDDLIFYDPDDTVITVGQGIDFLIQRNDDLPDSLDSLLGDYGKNVDVLVRVGENTDIANMTDLAHMGLTVENDTLTFSDQWTRDGNVFTNADTMTIVEVNAAETNLQANVVRLTLENNN